jgi:hypothetical protein
MLLQQLGSWRARAATDAQSASVLDFSVAATQAATKRAPLFSLLVAVALRRPYFLALPRGGWVSRINPTPGRRPDARFARQRRRWLSGQWTDLLTGRVRIRGKYM